MLEVIGAGLGRTGTHTLQQDWLPAICASEDPQIRSEGLGQTGKQLFHTGDYDRALAFLEQSLAIRREIGDSSGLCATLFNIGHIYAQNKALDKALSAWLTAYRLAKETGLAQVLQALSDLAPRIGLPPGLDGWEQLLQRSQGGK